MLESEQFQIPVDALPQRAVLDAVQSADEFEIFGRFQVGVETRLFGHVADESLVIEQLRLDVLTLPSDLASRRPKQSDQHLDRGALARSVGPQQAHHLARPRRQAEHAYCGDSAVAF